MVALKKLAISVTDPRPRSRRTRRTRKHASYECQLYLTARQERRSKSTASATGRSSLVAGIVFLGELNDTHIALEGAKTVNSVVLGRRP